MAHHDPNLKLKIFGTIGVTAMLFLCAVGYGMGKSNLDERRAHSQRQEDHANQVTVSLRKRLQMCKSESLSISSGHATQQDLEKRSQMQADALRSESDMLLLSNNDLLETLVDCETQIDKPRDPLHSDAVEQIEQLQFKNHKLQEAHHKLRAEKSELVKKKRRYIDALRVENHILRNKMKNRMTAARRSKGTSTADAISKDALMAYLKDHPEASITEIKAKFLGGTP